MTEQQNQQNSTPLIHLNFYAHSAKSLKTKQNMNSTNVEK